MHKEKYNYIKQVCRNGYYQYANIHKDEVYIKQKYRFPYNVQSAETDPPALMEEGRTNITTLA